MPADNNSATSPHATTVAAFNDVSTNEQLQFFGQELKRVRTELSRDTIRLGQITDACASLRKQIEAIDLEAAEAANAHLEASLAGSTAQAMRLRSEVEYLQKEQAGLAATVETSETRTTKLQADVDGSVADLVQHAMVNLLPAVIRVIEAGNPAASDGTQHAKLRDARATVASMHNSIRGKAQRLETLRQQQEAASRGAHPSKDTSPPQVSQDPEAAEAASRVANLERQIAESKAVHEGLLVDLRDEGTELRVAVESAAQKGDAMSTQYDADAKLVDALHDRLVAEKCVQCGGPLCHPT